VSCGAEWEAASDANGLEGVEVNVRIDESVYGVEKRVHDSVGARTVRPRWWYGGGGLGVRERVCKCWDAG
jgi:hypothetical protein